MPVNRFFSEQPFSEGDLISLEGEEFHHLVNATRKRIGDLVEVINGNGFLSTGKLIDIQKNKALIALESVIEEAAPNVHIILIQAIPRLNRLDTIIEKATELGVFAIHLFPGDTSERKELSSSSLARLKKITQSAIKQSGHLHLPKILMFQSLKESLPEKGLLFFGDVDPHAPLLMDVMTQSESIAIVIGPESGLTSNEEALLKKERGVGVKLSNAILRTDTAPIVALGLMSHILMRKEA